MALSVQRIVDVVFPAWAAARKLPVRVLRAARAIRRCRTAALGTHARVCPQGHVVEVRYNSCRHRSCPTCAARRSARWLESLKTRLLPTAHYQAVFTIDHDLIPLWRYNRQAIAEAMFLAARMSLIVLLGDPGRLGVLPGIVM